MCVLVTFIGLNDSLYHVMVEMYPLVKIWQYHCHCGSDPSVTLQHIQSGHVIMQI